MTEDDDDDMADEKALAAADDIQGRLFPGSVVSPCELDRTERGEGRDGAGAS